MSNAPRVPGNDSGGKEAKPAEIDYKAVCLLLLDLIVTAGVWQTRNATKDSIWLTNQWIIAQAEQIAAALQITSPQKEHLLRFIRMFEHLDSSIDGGEREAAWTNILETFRREAQERRQS